MKIAYGNSRMDKKWKNTDISWEDFCSCVKTTQRTTETVEEYGKMRKCGQDSIKDVGGFVGGHLKDGRRKKGNVLYASEMVFHFKDSGTVRRTWEQPKRVGRPWTEEQRATSKERILLKDGSR